MVSDVIKTTQKNLKLNNIKSIEDIYNTKNKIVSFSNNMRNFDIKIKYFLKHKMYFHKSVSSKTHHGRKIIKKLFAFIKKNPKKFINIKNYKNISLERIICDYIAGMTDRYAINIYNKIK